MGKSDRIRAAVCALAEQYPVPLRPWQREEIDKQAFQVALATEGVPRGATIADIGAGHSLFPPACAALGYHALCVDDFSDVGDLSLLAETETLVHRPLGVKMVTRDILADGVDFPASSLDVVTTFATLEHLHHSPKRLLHQLMTALKPGGRFVIGVPNVENLRKRLGSPFGITWSHISDWYEKDTFRGHVREPNVGDLHYIARDLGLVDVTLYGRNWIGYISPKPWVRALTPYADRLLQHWPSLCSDIYVVGRRP